MNKKQIKTMKMIDESEGIGEDVKNIIIKWDNEGKIPPHFQIIPLLYLAVDNTKYGTDLGKYGEYEKEYL